MCGIFIAFNHSELDTECLEAYNSALLSVIHRGPDCTGTHIERCCFLGHTRLAILSLDANSNQPFIHNDLVIVYNGELFNYKEIKRDLVELGHSFHTESDTEVVLKAYSQWECDAFSRFNGMWSLAIYDTSRKCLIVSRDRFGQKPLFIATKDSTVLIASEPHQLLPIVDKTIDYYSIQSFLKEGLPASEGHTFFASIKEFPRACALKINNSGKWSFQRYWEYPNAKPLPSSQDSVDSFESILGDAVRLRLQSDVPIGLMLSGGVDSRLIALHIQQAHARPLKMKAFTYSSGNQCDEYHSAQAVSDSLNLQLIKVSQADVYLNFREQIHQLVRHLGRGHSSSAILPIDLLYAAANKEGIKVVLDGQGADELLGGYISSAIPAVLSLLKRGDILASIAIIKRLGLRQLAQAIILFLRLSCPSPVKRAMRYLYGYEKYFSRLPSPSRSSNPFINVPKPVNINCDFLNQFLIRQHSTNLPNLLYYGDIVSMKNSIENRSPFLDHRLVEFAFSHDCKLKYNMGLDKYALRASRLYRLFPALITKKKIGFSTPIPFETKLLMLDDLKDSSILQWPIFSKRIHSLLNLHELLSPKYEKLLFRLYQVHAWNNVFSDHVS